MNAWGRGKPLDASKRYVTDWRQMKEEGNIFIKTPLRSKIQILDWHGYDSEHLEVSIVRTSLKLRGVNYPKWNMNIRV